MTDPVPVEPVAAPWDPPLIHEVLAQVRDAPRRQQQTADALDAKAMWALGAGAIALGLMGPAAASAGSRAVVWPVAAAIVAFAVLAGFAIGQLWTRTYYVVDGARGIMQPGWEPTVDDLRRWLVLSTGEAWERNAAANELKATLARVYLIALAVEALAVAAVVVVAVLT